MTSNDLKTRIVPLITILVASTVFAVASPIIVPPLPPTVPHSGGIVAELSPIIVPPLPSTVPHSGGIVAELSPIIVPPLPPTVPHSGGNAIRS